MIISMGAMTYLAGLAILDARDRELSVRVLLLGTLGAVTCALFYVLTGAARWEDLLFGTVPGLILLALAGMTKGAGVGDGVVLLQVNFFLLLDRVILAFGISLLVMGLFSGMILITKKGTKDTRLPYLPFLWLGCLGTFCIR